MKKLLGISLIAILAVSPMMASAADPAPTPVAGEPTHADPATNASAAPGYALKMSASTDNNMASAGYVKGAYNAAIKAINKVASDTTTALGSKQDTITAGNGITKSGSTISADLTDKGGLKLNGSTDGSKTIGVDLDGTSVKINTTSGKLEVGTIGFTNVASGAVATSVDATNASAEKLTTESAVRSAITSATSGMVTASSTNTFTNKTFNAEGTGNSISNLKTSNFKDGTIVTTVGETGSDTALPTEKAVRTAIGNAVTGLGMDNYATIAGVDKTIKAVNLSTQSGTSNIMTNWESDSSTVSVTYLTSAAIDDSSVSYTDANTTSN